MAEAHLEEVINGETGAILVLCVQSWGQKTIPVPVLEDVGDAGVRVAVVGHGRPHPRHHGAHVAGDQRGQQQVRQLRRGHHRESVQR